MPAHVSVLQLLPMLGARCPCQLQGVDSIEPGVGNDGSIEIVNKPSARREFFFPPTLPSPLLSVKSFAG